jgi:membrane-associated protease RseP (regulator of RpoE activity)
MHQAELSGDKTPQVFEYFHQAQILWDETMAESIATFLADHPDYRLVVLAGNGHLAFGSGIPKRAYRRTGKDYAIVLPDPGEPLEPGLADFVLFPNMVEAPPDAKLGVALDRSKGQLEVNSFVRGSGAEEAGMEEGDIILAIDGQKIESFDEIRTYLASKNVGDWVQVKIKRGKKKMELRVKLGAPTQHGR